MNGSPKCASLCPSLLVIKACHSRKDPAVHFCVISRHRLHVTGAHERCRRRLRHPWPSVSAILRGGSKSVAHLASTLVHFGLLKRPAPSITALGYERRSCLLLPCRRAEQSLASVRSQSMNARRGGQSAVSGKVKA